jgi:nitrogen fixation protein FixH
MIESTPRKSDKWIPWYFVAFFVVIAILDGIFVTIAASTHTGVITEKAYQKGLDYNQVVAASESQDKLGWTGNIHLSQNTINFEIKDSQNMPLKGAKVTAYFTRTTQAGYDFSIPLEANAEGIYNQHINFPLKGLWDVRILATWNQQQYQKSKQIVAR